METNLMKNDVMGIFKNPPHIPNWKGFRALPLLIKNFTRKEIAEKLEVSYPCVRILLEREKRIFKGELKKKGYSKELFIEALGL